ncbi:glycosyltransferase [Paenibacillus filicis]|uniref:Glycosyltransferase n=1 Tax=Paenibacillus filicis TaxID=669464 RepID=A0ABU9DR14_9BACL
MDGRPMKISLIVLAQHFRLTVQCIDRIKMHTSGSYELILVNDACTDEQSGYLERLYGVRVLSNGGRGVAAGYNLGASAASGERIVFLRDQMMVTDGWLEQLSACLDQCPDAGMAGPRMNDVSGPQRVPILYKSYDQLDQIKHVLTMNKQFQWNPVPRLVGLLFMVTRQCLERVGGFDERFEVESYEDDDWCYRAVTQRYGLYMAEGCFVIRVEPPSLFPEEPDWYATRLTLNRAKAIMKWGFDPQDALHRLTRQVTVSLCMIVKNEELTLGRCLSSVRGLVDEIIIVDTGSEDRTKEIAAAYTDRVYDFKWVNDFSQARNYAFGLATQEFVLWLDADDRLEPEDAERFRKLKASLPWDTDAVSMHYNLSRDGQGRVTASLRRNRLVKRSNGFRWFGAVHEYLDVAGKVIYSDIGVTHDRKHQQSDRNLLIYEERLSRSEQFTARDHMYYANELYDHGLWQRAAEQYDRFLSLPDGWVEDRILACGRASDALHRLGQAQEARMKALQSFTYGMPRAEICCRLGDYELNANRPEEAEFWYKLAAEVRRPADPNARLDLASWTWVPHLQLCVCYDRMGLYEQAYRHNELAAGYVPEHPSVLANRNYLEQQLSLISQEA